MSSYRGLLRPGKTEAPVIWEPRARGGLTPRRICTLSTHLIVAGQPHRCAPYFEQYMAKKVRPPRDSS